MKILCYGDSNTYGYDPRSYIGSRYVPEDRWVDILAARTGWTFLNAGQNGREIPRHDFEKATLIRCLKEHDPVDLLVVMLGSNDLLQGASVREAVNRMECFLQDMLSHCGNILLVPPPPLKAGAWVTDLGLVAASNELDAQYRKLAGGLGIFFADTQGFQPELCFDGVHFTQADHHRFAQILLPEIQKAAV